MEKINKNIGLFILNYNGLKWIKNNLKSIVKKSCAKIIIIDNNSSDDSVKYIANNFPKIKIHAHKKNYGFCKGYNKILLQESEFEYFILMNNDVMVTENWILPMLKIIQQPNIGIVQPKIKKLTIEKLNVFKKTNFFDYAGAAGGFIDCLGIPFCRGRIINTIEEDNNQYYNKEILWASGACFMIKKKLYQQLQGFDEDFFMHQEEIDLCWRSKSFKKKTYYCSQSTVFHLGGGTLDFEKPKKHFYNHRNNLLLLSKNLKSPSIIVVILARLIMDYFIIIKYLLFGLNFNKKSSQLIKSKWKEIQVCFYIILAHIQYFKLLPKFLKKRKPIKNDLIYNGSIIFDYFFRKRKKFTELKKF